MSITPKPPQIVPYLVYRDIGAALDFLYRAFGFKRRCAPERRAAGCMGRRHFRASS
jgi:hypothetical protein